MITGIYKITNTLNGKVYIGQSKNISQRWKAHRTRYQTEDSLLYRAMRKYGIENFTFEVIEECDIDQLNDREIYWIAYYQANNCEKGYNLTIGGAAITSSKLQEKEVQEIIKLLQNTGISQDKIAKQFNVDQKTISNINTGETWLQKDVIYPIRSVGFANKFRGQVQITEEDRKKYEKGNVCIICGKPICYSSTYCSTCLGYQHRVVKDRPTRSVLKYLIRTTPFTKIGEQYGVSDNAIRKWCKGYDLPFKSREIRNYTDEEWGKI